MKYFPVVLLFFWMLSFENSEGQGIGNFTYSDTFVVNTSYCPSDRQYDNWAKFRARLDTVNFKILKVSMRGSYSTSGRVCNDSFAARKLAAALKNPPTGTSFTLICDGNTWVVSYLGSCMSGCSQTTDNVGFGADGASNACACLNPSWQIRPTIGNSNWGGVNTVSCNPSPTQRMTAEFGYRLYESDAAVISITPIDLCKNPNSIFAKIKNSGSKVLDSVRISWTLNGAIQGTNYFKKSLLTGKDTLINLKNGLSLSPYTNYEIKVWTSKPNGYSDQYTANDTVSYKFRYSGAPNTPDARDTALCGTSRHSLICKPNNVNDSLLWFGTKTSTAILGIGSKYLTEILFPGKYKYFIGSSNQIIKTHIESNFSGGNQQAGFMLDVKALQGVTIDSLAVNLGATLSTSANMEVYFRDGGYTGYESNASAWTLLGKYNIISKGPGFPSIIPAKLTITSGKTIGIYVQTTNAPAFYLQYGNGNYTYNDGILQLNTGSGIAMNWGGTFSSRNGNIRFYYKKPSCISSRDSMIVAINSRPSGAMLIKGVPFNSPDLSTAGISSNPDIASVSKELNYELKVPKGYSNADFGKSWIVSDLRVVKPSGKSVISSDTNIALPGKLDNCKIKFVPDKSLEDSIITIFATIKDLLGNQCDSLIQRKIYIAPTPKTNFSATAVCSGTPVEFKNKTSLLKGNMTYKWYFGNGDSSTSSEPIYLYPVYGIYKVKLIAKTSFGIIKDTIIEVAVHEIPDIKYKVINACSGDSLSFVNSSSISSGAINFKWFFGDSKTSTKINPRYRYANYGDYIVTLLASANGCSSTLSKKANQFVRPVANFSSIGNCSNNEILFKNLTTIGLGENFGSNWIFDLDGGNNETNPSHTFDNPGTKRIKFTATSQFGCTDSMVKLITIFASPIAIFTNSATCNVKPVLFNNQSFEPNGLITSYIWSFGDGIFSSNKNPEHKYPEIGIKTVRLTALGNNGCSTLVEKSINILPQPIANFEAMDACLGEDVVFTNKTKGSGQINFKWNFGDGDSSKLFSPIKKYKAKSASTFNVTLTAKNVGGCQDVITIPINLRETPVCDFTFESAGTGGFEYVFKPKITSYPFYQWTFQGGGSSNDVSPKFKFERDGKYRVTVSMKNADGCDCLDSIHFVSVFHTGIRSVSGNFGFKFYPNPNQGILYLELDKIQENEGIIINLRSITGQILFTENLKKEEFQNLYLGNLANGLYTIEAINTEGNKASGKLLIFK